jgi:hypothetical protein
VTVAPGSATSGRSRRSSIVPVTPAVNDTVSASPVNAGLASIDASASISLPPDSASRPLPSAS